MFMMEAMPGIRWRRSARLFFNTGQLRYEVDLG